MDLPGSPPPLEPNLLFFHLYITEWNWLLIAQEVGNIVWNSFYGNQAIAKLTWKPLSFLAFLPTSNDEGSSRSEDEEVTQQSDEEKSDVSRESENERDESDNEKADSENDDDDFDQPAEESDEQSDAEMKEAEPQDDDASEAGDADSDVEQEPVKKKKTNRVISS